MPSMAAQQAQFAETMRAMKLALKRNRAASPTAPSSSTDDSDSDGLHMHTNRGNKRKRSARYVHEGRLDTTGGQASYKRKVRHAGYERHIIAQRPRLYDEDGDVVDPLDVASDGEEEERASGEPVREDAFGEVRLEQLLRPLTSAAELPEHPSLSAAYTSSALTQMAREAAGMVRREKATLWKAKRLLERFRGDGGWMACGRFETAECEGLLLREGEGERSAAGESVGEVEMGKPVLDEDGVVIGEEDGVAVQDEVEGNGDLMDGIEARDHLTTVPRPDLTGESAQPEDTTMHDTHEPINGTQQPDDTPPTTLSNPTITDLTTTTRPDSDESTSNPSLPSHAMTTRARARSPQPPTSPTPTIPSSTPSTPPINPWFLPPASALPDPSLGLPSPEAEDTRKLLLLYVQKQENIVRQLSALYTGLQRTDRLRREVWRACKAEGHMVPVAEGDGNGGVRTEMSDGEDWFDGADWGLQGGEVGVLEKGKDEVEDAAEEEGRRVGGRRRRVVGR